MAHHLYSHIHLRSPHASNPSGPSDENTINDSHNIKTSSSSNSSMANDDSPSSEQASSEQATEQATEQEVTPTPTARNRPRVTTVTEVQLTTLVPTFGGEVGGFSTLAPSPSAARVVIKAEPLPTPTAITMADGQLGDAADAGGEISSIDDLGILPPAIESSPGIPSDNLPTTLAKASSGSISSSTSNKPTSASTSSASTTSGQATPALPGQDLTSSSNAGDDDGAGLKAGIAMGVLGGVLLVILAFWFSYSRRRKPKARLSLDDDDEKTTTAAVLDRPLPRSPSPAPPQLSVRPVTQLMPGNWMERRTSKAAAAHMAAAAATQRSSGSADTLDRPTTADRGNRVSSSNGLNPFGTGAQRISSSSEQQDQMMEPVSPVSSGGDNRSVSPTSIRERAVNDPFTAPGPHPPMVAGRRPGTSGSTAPGQGPTSRSREAAPNSPAAGGPKNPPVHRVQLDFTPTLQDELELRAGQLIRLLHEYDDGWSLCTRLDRSQQGVVPRTCLSTRPVKPRTPPGSVRHGPPIKPIGGPNMGRGSPDHPQPLRPTTPNAPLNSPRHHHSPSHSRPERPWTPQSYTGGTQMPPGQAL